VTYSAGGETRTLPVFLKYQCGRGLKLWLQAIRAALEPGVAPAMGGKVIFMPPRIFHERFSVQHKRGGGARK
jgi:hypothetical protein